MIELKSKLRRWGNSFGIVIPQRVLGDGAMENEEIIVFVERKKPDLRKLFGAHKFSKPTEKLMNEMDEELYNE